MSARPIVLETFHVPNPEADHYAPSDPIDPRREDLVAENENLRIRQQILRLPPELRRMLVTQPASSCVKQ
jgi:hypothetical protein